MKNYFEELEFLIDYDDLDGFKQTFLKETIDQLFGKIGVIHSACWEGAMDILQYLIDSGANLDLKDGDGRGPFYHAIDGKGGLEVIEKLVENGATFSFDEFDDPDLDDHNNLIGVLHERFLGSVK